MDSAWFAQEIDLGARTCPVIVSRSNDSHLLWPAEWGAAARCRATRSIHGSRPTQVHEGACASLKRHRLDVERVGKGTECGVLLEGFAEFRQGDVLQCIELEMVAPGKESLVPQAQAQYA